MSSPGYPAGTHSHNQVFYLSNNNAKGYSFHVIDLDLGEECEDRLEIISSRNQFKRIDSCSRFELPLKLDGKKVKVEFFQHGKHRRGYKIHFKIIKH